MKHFDRRSYDWAELNHRVTEVTEASVAAVPPISVIRVIRGFLACAPVML